MTNGEALLLSPDDQLRLTVDLYRDGLFGIQEDPKDFIPLKSKRISPHYLDIRPGISSYKRRRQIASAMVDIALARAVDKRFSTIKSAYEHFAGTPETMTSYAATTADQSFMSLLQPRVNTTKSSGNKTPILGRYKTGDRVAVFDDVVTDGDSKIETIQKLEAAGLVVADYFVVVDREEGGAKQVAEMTGLEITSALAVSGMVMMLRAENEISATQFDNVAEYLKQYGDSQAKANLGCDI